MKIAVVRHTVADRATVTFHTSPETKARLDLLASVTRRSKSYLANMAVERYLAEEEDFIADIQAGIEDADTGRTIATEELKQSLSGHIEAVRVGKSPA